MKKLLTSIILILVVLFLTGCEGLDIPTNLTISTDVTLSTTEATTSNTTGEQTTIITTEPITTIINDEIYLQLNAGQDTVEINSKWIDAGAVFVLNDTSYDMVTEDTVDITTLSIYEIIYTYSYEEEVYSMTRYVIVTDQVSPEIELNLGVDTIKVGSTWTDANVTITDNSNESITPIVEGSVDTNTAGTYEIIYTATDSSGNESSVTRYVHIIE
jgi:hypothetical protein